MPEYTESMSEKRLDRILLISGLIIISFNSYWLYQFQFSWNVFTYESWVMLSVGILFIVPSILDLYRYLQSANILPSPVFIVAKETGTKVSEGGRKIVGAVPVLITDIVKIVIKIKWAILTIITLVLIYWVYKEEVIINWIDSVA